MVTDATAGCAVSGGATAVALAHGGAQHLGDDPDKPTLLAKIDALQER